MGTGRAPDGTGFLILGSVTVLPKGMGPEGSAICTKLGEFGAYVYSSEQRSFILKGVRDPITPRATAVKIKSILTFCGVSGFHLILKETVRPHLSFSLTDLLAHAGCCLKGMCSPREQAPKKSLISLMTSACLCHKPGCAKTDIGRFQSSRPFPL